MSTSKWLRCIDDVFFFLVICTCTSFHTAAVSKRTILFRRLDLDGRLVHNWTLVRPSSSVWECGGICSEDSDCMFVSFKPMPGECAIYHRFISTTDTFTRLDSATVYGRCPQQYSFTGRKCIRVVDDELDWNSARDSCREDNADLVTLDSQAVNEELGNFMQANGHASGTYWTGASRVSGQWQWFNGMPVSPSFWCANQGGDENQQCAVIKNLCFKDRYCQSDQGFVCEFQF